MVAELLAGHGELTAERLPVPTSRPATIPGGDYTARFSTPGRWSETWQIEIPQGQSQIFPVQLLDQQLGPPLEVTDVDKPFMLEMDGKTHILHRTERGWRLIRGDRLKPVWPQSLIKIPTAEEAASIRACLPTGWTPTYCRPTRPPPPPPRMSAVRQPGQRPAWPSHRRTWTPTANKT